MEEEANETREGKAMGSKKEGKDQMEGERKRKVRVNCNYVHIVANMENL